jgi:YebC/PmpR family DNA-binding regulatory protein
MSGHNKWSQIKHKKAKSDAKKGKAFTSLIKEITMSARAHGGDPANNAHLRLLIEKAKEINMPKENSDRAIKRGTGELPGVHYEAMRYEGYGPHGVAIIVDALTDNKNRTVANFRRMFSENNGSLGDTGTVSWMFKQCGVLRVPQNGLSEDDLLEKLLDFDVHDISLQDGTFSIICDAKSLDAVKKALEAEKLKVESAELEWVAKDKMELSEADSESVINLLTALDDHDDVQHVYTNLA